MSDWDDERLRLKQRAAVAVAEKTLMSRRLQEAEELLGLLVDQIDETGLQDRVRAFLAPTDTREPARGCEPWCGLRLKEIPDEATAFFWPPKKASTPYYCSTDCRAQGRPLHPSPTGEKR